MKKDEKWKTEVLGHTIRVIDEVGNDIVVVGSVANKENIEIANLVASAPEMKELLSVVSQLESSFNISLPPKISERIKTVLSNGKEPG
jgi:hypothetical protein